MNDNTQTNGPVMNGDDELAKTLSGGLKFGDMPDDSSTTAIDDPSPDDSTPPSLSDLPKPSDDADNSDDSSQAPPSHSSSDLDKLKSSALDDLKPLVGKLNLSAEEKFDTLLLLIRSTDDHSLLAEAHAAAKEISDDSKRAQALLDIIKEVDYFNSKK